MESMQLSDWLTLDCHASDGTIAHWQSFSYTMATQLLRDKHMRGTLCAADAVGLKRAAKGHCNRGPINGGRPCEASASIC